MACWFTPYSTPMKSNILASILVAGSLATSPATAQSPATRPADAEPHASPDAYTVGVCVHFVQRKGLLPENVRMMKDAGVESIRDEVPWDVVEQVKGKLVVPQRVDDYVNAALEADMAVMLVLDYGSRFYEKGTKPKAPESIAAFANYVRHIATHFKGRVRQYEVWNEWNIGIGTATGEKGTPEGYMNLLEPTYRAIREADPDAEVIGAVVAPQALGDGFFDKLVTLGLTDHCDAVSVHTYNYAARPAERRRPEAWLATMQRIQKLVRDNTDGRSVPIYVTEHGWPTQAGNVGTPEQVSADYLARMYLLSRTLEDVGGIWWYDFQDDGWSPQYNEDNFGLVKANLSPKPSYFAFQAVARFLATATLEGRVETGDPDVWVLRFRHSDRRRSLAVWSAGRPREVVLAPRDGAAERPVGLEVVGRAPVERTWRHRDWVGKPQSEVVKRLAVIASSTPLLIHLPQGDADVESVSDRIPPATRPAPRPATQPASRP